MDSTILSGAIGGLVSLIGVAVALRVALSYRKQTMLQRTTALVVPRVTAYGLLVRRLRPYTETIPAEKRQQLANEMQSWYYEEGGWLMDGTTFNCYLEARAALLHKGSNEEKIRKAVSALRTQFKIEVGARMEKERDVQYADAQERKL